MPDHAKDVRTDTTAVKAYVAFVATVLGAGITTALGLISQGSTLFIVLTIVSAMLTVVTTTYGVWRATNTPLEAS